MSEQASKEAPAAGGTKGTQQHQESGAGQLVKTGQEGMQLQFQKGDSNRQSERLREEFLAEIELIHSEAAE